MHTTEAAPRGARPQDALRDARGERTTALPSGWWIVPAVLSGAAVWALIARFAYGLFASG